MTRFTSPLAALSVACAILPTSASAVATFTDRAAWEAAVNGSFAVEDFNGPAILAPVASTGTPIGEFTTVDRVGPGGPPADTGSNETGLDGAGFFFSEVDFSPPDLQSLAFQTGPMRGFGLVGLDSQPPGISGSLDLEEIAVIFAGETFIASDVVGLTDSANAPLPGIAEGGPVFLGFVSETVQTGFRIVHTADVLGDDSVIGGNEDFMLD